MSPNFWTKFFAQIIFSIIANAGHDIFLLFVCCFPKVAKILLQLDPVASASLVRWAGEFSSLRDLLDNKFQKKSGAVTERSQNQIILEKSLAEIRASRARWTEYFGNN